MFERNDYGDEDEWSGLESTVGYFSTTQIQKLSNIPPLISPLRGKLRPKSAISTTSLRNDADNMNKLKKSLSEIESHPIKVPDLFQNSKSIQKVREHSKKINEDNIQLDRDIHRNEREMKMSLAMMVKEANEICCESSNERIEYVIIPKADINAHKRMTTQEFKSEWQHGSIGIGGLVIIVRHKITLAIVQVLSLNRFERELSELRRGYYKNIAISRSHDIRHQQQADDIVTDTLASSLKYIDKAVTEVLYFDAEAADFATNPRNTSANANNNEQIGSTLGPANTTTSENNNCLPVSNRVKVDTKMLQELLVTGPQSAQKCGHPVGL